MLPVGFEPAIPANDRLQTHSLDRARHWDRHFNPLNAELNTICHLLALLGAHHIFHVSELRVKHRVLLLHLSTVTWLRRRPRSEVEFALAMGTAQPVVE